MTRRLPKLTAACLVALVCAAALAGCGKSSNKAGETVREGLSTPLSGLRYTVFMTRQLNLANEEDRGYVPGIQEPAPRSTYYGVFLEACNQGKGIARAANVENFYIEDTQGNRFDPKPLASENPFAWAGGAVDPKNCEPARGSLAQQGPTSGAMLLFELPIGATENRPLELHIEGPLDTVAQKRNEATVILDL